MPQSTAEKLETIPPPPRLPASLARIPAEAIYPLFWVCWASFTETTSKRQSWTYFTAYTQNLRVAFRASEGDSSTRLKGLSDLVTWTSSFIQYCGPLGSLLRCIIFLSVALIAHHLGNHWFPIQNSGMLRLTQIWAQTQHAWAPCPSLKPNFLICRLLTITLTGEVSFYNVSWCLTQNKEPGNFSYPELCKVPPTHIPLSIVVGHACHLLIDLNLYKLYSHL